MVINDWGLSDEYVKIFVKCIFHFGRPEKFLIAQTLPPADEVVLKG